MATDNTAPMTTERLAYIRSGIEANDQGWGYVARSTIAELLAEVERQRAVIAEQQAELAAMRPIVAAMATMATNVSIDGVLACPFCERWIGPNLPHAEDCTVLAARAYLAAHPEQVSPMEAH